MKWRVRSWQGSLQHNPVQNRIEIHCRRQRAEAAGIRLLAYYHMVPVPVNALAANMFLRGLPDDVILVDDLQAFDLPTGSTDIIVHEP